MRVAFLVGQFPTLSETFILNQITGLIDLGVEVEIIAESKPDEKKHHPDIDKYHLMQRVHYLNMPKNRATRLIRGLYLVVANMHRKPLSLLWALNPLYGQQSLALRLLFTVIPFLDKEYDIIHCHFGQNGVTGSCLKDIGVKGKLVTSFYGSDLSSFVLKNPKRYGRLFSNADLLIPISDNLKGKLITLGCDEKKLRVHRMGIRLNRFESKPHTMNKGEAVTILTIGRLVEKKGHRYSIEAFAKVAKDRNICYLIAGDGPLRGELEALVARLGVGDKVEFLGEVTQDEAIAVYNKAHIFILASVTAADGDQEGVPVVLMEAQASGIPTISTLHAGIPEVVEDGKTGYLATEKNVNAMADNLRSLIDHPEQCLMMGEKGRKLVEEKYDSDKLNHELARIYQGLLKGATKKQV